MSRWSRYSTAIRARSSALALGVIVAALAWPAIALRLEGTPGGADQMRDNLGIIDSFASSLRTMPLRDYSAVSAPGYYIFLAVLVRVLPLGVEALQYLGSVVGIALVWVVAAPVRRHQSPGVTLLLVLPFALSSYVTAGSIWVLTDNPGWWLALGALSLLATDAPPSVTRLWASGLVGALAVGVRQVHIWIVVPLLVANWRRRSRWGMLAALLPVVPGAVLFAIWGGFAPVSFAARAGGVNPTAAIMTLALFGLFGSVTLPLVGLGPAKERATLALCAALAGGYSLLVPTTYDFCAGRWGGVIWSATDMGPVLGSHSLVLTVFAMLGGIVLYRLVAAARHAGHGETALLLVAAIVGFTLALSLSRMTFQRYSEPMVLAMIAWLTGLSFRGPVPRWRVAPQVLLIVAMLGLTLGSVYFRPAALTPDWRAEAGRADPCGAPPR